MYVGLLLGLVLGLWLAQRHIDHLLIIYYHFRFRSAKKYLELYDLCDGETALQMMQGQENPPESYAEFLLWHQEARPQAGKVFRKYWLAITRELVRDYAVFVLIPAALLLLWKATTYFLLMVFLVHVILLLQRKLVKKNGVNFYALLVYTLVLTETIETDDNKH